MGNWAPIGPVFDDEADRKRASKEIRSAIAADKGNRKFPPLKTVSFLIEHNRLNILSQDETKELADFLAGIHRGKRGEKKDRDQQRQDDIDRANLFCQYIQETGSRNTALEKLLTREKLKETRSIERAISRGLKYMEEDEQALKLKILELEFKLKRIKEENEAKALLRNFIIPDPDGT